MNKMLKSPCMKIIIDIRHSISLDVSLFSYFNRYVYSVNSHLKALEVNQVNVISIRVTITEKEIPS